MLIVVPFDLAHPPPLPACLLPRSASPFPSLPPSSLLTVVRHARAPAQSPCAWPLAARLPPRLRLLRQCLPRAQPRRRPPFRCQIRASSLLPRGLLSAERTPRPRMLDSPRVVACLGAEVSFVDHAPSFNIFLEYMPEGSIADLIQRTGGKLDEMTATACTRAIVEGLCYLHSQGIVHSDIKARNILLGSSGEIKIADFGAARKTSCTKDSDSVSIGGTPLWMAPEVLQGLRQGAPSDIWSLGCTLIEMLEGRPPWNTLQSHPSCTDLVSVLLRIACASETLPPYGDSISSQAKDFLSKCLRRDPAERWTAEQLLQHPFVMTKEGSLSGLVQLLSPRSVLDFYTDSDEDSIASSDPLMDCTCTAYPSCPGMQEMEVVVHDDMFVTCWHTIRCAESWSETRQKSFFNAGEKLTMKRGSDVSFESVKFLTTVNRKERGRREGNCMDIRRSPAQQMQSLLT